MEKKDYLDHRRPIVNVEEVDAALVYLKNEGTAVMTEIDEKKLVRKIDWMIVPLMWCCYTLQYLDKTLINYAAASPSLEHITSRVLILGRLWDFSRTHISILANSRYWPWCSMSCIWHLRRQQAI